MKEIKEWKEFCGENGFAGCLTEWIEAPMGLTFLNHQSKRIENLLLIA